MSGTAYSSMNPPKAGTGFEKETRRNERAGRVPGASAGRQRGETILTFVGRSMVRIENYRSILVYSDTYLKIQAGKYRLSIDGRNLRIRYYDKDEMEITGNIDAIGFDER